MHVSRAGGAEVTGPTRRSPMARKRSLATADARQAHELRKKCFDFIMRHFGKVIGTKSFTELSKELLEEILFAASKRGVYVR